MVERLDHRDRVGTRAEQPDEEVARAGRPRVTDGRRALGETLERITIDHRRELGRESRRT